MAHERHRRPTSARRRRAWPEPDPLCIITGVITILPVICLFFVAWQVWGAWRGWNDIFVFLIMYVLTGLGITVGFHRLFMHRAFKTSPFMRGVFAVCGSMAIEGPVIRGWPTTASTTPSRISRRPAQPARRPRLGLARRDQGPGPRARRLAVPAHPPRPPDELRAGSDRDLVVSRVDKLFVPCVALGLIARLFGGVRRTLRDGFTGLLWGCAGLHDDLLDQLPLPLLRQPPLRDEGRVAQPAVARPAHVRGGVATTTRSRPRPRTGCASAGRFDPSALVIDGIKARGLGRRPRDAGAAGHQVRCRGLTTEPLRTRPGCGPALPDRPDGTEVPSTTPTARRSPSAPRSR